MGLMGLIRPIRRTATGFLILNSYLLSSYGTGSYPLPPHGLQRNILHIARARPLTGPCFFNACLAYSEHVGVNRHEGGVNGDMHFW